MRSLLLVALAAISAAPGLAANIVVNGDFETGDLTGWTVNASANYPWQVLDYYPLDGSYSALTACSGMACVDSGDSGVASLSQDLPTTPGGVYTLTFLETNGGAPEDLVVLWDGNVVLDLCPGSNNCGYTPGDQFTVSGLVAASDSTALTFLGEDGPGFIRLDDVDVEASAAPEPAAFFMACAGTLAIAAAVRKTRREA